MIVVGFLIGILIVLAVYGAAMLAERWPWAVLWTDLLLLGILVLFFCGCAARVGPIEWAVGDAIVIDCPTTAGPTCQTEVKGGTLSAVFGNTVGRLIDAAARFFHADPPPEAK